ncbi:ectoine synthase [Nocardia iowensis]|uniref:Ectoine synthase n=1 Tax=Nocardia iowensis TaxID=204891 RepID=A0ABX8RM69_NOCIO|nr:ectoine synthase [Nocardia iowensis]QXN90728.1 ectoine synthase [Nocardia iowensis]
MLKRALDDVLGTQNDVEWGNGTSRRLLTDADNRGFTLTETYVRPGTESHLRYDNHIEACYCIEGSGSVENADGSFAITVGTVYAPDKGEEHILRSAHGMRLVCVFSPALKGSEQHSLDLNEYSSY